MAGSVPSDASIMTKGSDNFPDVFCNPCFEVDGKVLPSFGFCQECSDQLCFECFSGHKRHKYSRDHHLSENTYATGTRKHTKDVNNADAIVKKCTKHTGEVIQSYCMSCDQLCCGRCQSVDHQNCKMKTLSTAADVDDFQRLVDLNKKTSLLKSEYNDNLSKAEKQSINVNEYHTEATKEMKKLREKFEKLLYETEKQAEEVKDEDLKKMKSVSTTCSTIIEQISELSEKLKTAYACSDKEAMVVTFKQAESQLQLLEDQLTQLDTDNTVHKYTFKPDVKLQAMLGSLKVLGKLSFSSTTHPESKLKTLLYVEDIELMAPGIRGTVMLPNQHLLSIEIGSGVKIIDIKQNKIVSRLQLPITEMADTSNNPHRNSPLDVTLVSPDEVAMTRESTASIQFVSISNNKLSKGREIPVDGQCYGIAYSDQDCVLVVSFIPSKIEILTLTGAVIKRFHPVTSGAPLYRPERLALSPDKTLMYVSDMNRNLVVLVNVRNGEVIGEIKNKMLRYPWAICVSESGIVFVTSDFNSVYRIMTGSDQLELILDGKNGLKALSSVTYCEVEDKLYVGSCQSSSLKVFKMK